MINYSTYVTQLSNLMGGISSATPQFQTFLPGCIDYAEQRIYRELDLLDTVVNDNTGSLTSLNRIFNLPTSIGAFIVLNGINVITPAGTAAASGQRNELQQTSREYLDSVWNSSTGATLPKYYAVVGGTAAQNGPGQIIVGPWPDQNYGIEAIGTVRPTPLSAGNPTTLLTNYVPDIFIAASMVFASAYQKNFGAQSDNPQMAMSWEQQYKELMGSAVAEQLRSKGAGPGWTPLSAVAPTPTR